MFLSLVRFYNMIHIDIAQFEITNSINLKDRPTRLELGLEDELVKKELKSVRKKLGKLQDTMYAHGKYGVLVCIQGMDTSGKDSMIREIFKDFNSAGIVVHSFKVPTSKELSHDYLWRHYIALPERGKFGIFNRTHYENVLVTKVHPAYILGENIPSVTSIENVNDTFWESRYNSINDFEKHIANNGMIIFKFFLNLSKEEQKFRLLRRLNIEEKHWKFSPGDLKGRKLWDKYQECYEEAINRTSKEHAPWYTIPADNKSVARYIVAKIMLERLSTYSDIKEPDLEDEVRANIELYKQQLENE